MDNTHTPQERVVDVAVIGSGPAGLMAAQVLVEVGRKVEVFDSKPSFARKLLMAGKSGLNITKTEYYDDFLNHYSGRSESFDQALESFSPPQVQAWCQSLGVETFTGTSGRVFPKVMKASPLLRVWLAALVEKGASFSSRHRWCGFDGDKLIFETQNGILKVKAGASILAFGGGSWARLGSDGRWVEILRKCGVEVMPFQPSNCGFECAWDSHFIEKFGGQPIKNVTVEAAGETHKGDFIVTRHGVEGGVIYMLSRRLLGETKFFVDLKPNMAQSHLEKALAKPRGRNSFSNHLRKTIKLSGAKAGLLRMAAPDVDKVDIERLAGVIKKLPISVKGPRPLDEAISTAGGVSWQSIDDRFMIKTCPGTFVAGEMIAWDAPTGGYLMTACLATGKAAGEGALRFLEG